MTTTQPVVHVLRVFCDQHGDHGNALGVVLDGPAVRGQDRRQAIAHALGFSETVFVDGPGGELQIFTPEEELPLAGHPLVGTAWLLNREGRAVSTLRPPAGPVACAVDGSAAQITADPAASPHWDLVAYASAAEIDALDPVAFGPSAHAYAWAWEDEPAGLVRARSFPSGKGILEDEATGSAALVLCGALGRAITIRQGRGSVISAELVEHGLVRVGGQVRYDEQRALLSV